VNLPDRPFKMTASLSKCIFVALAIGWYLIRFEYARKSRRAPVLKSGRGFRETALMLISLTGLGIVPLLYVVTAIPHFAAYTFQPAQAWLGLCFAVAALVMFRLTHRTLGRNWSVSLDVRKDHQLITGGIYQKVRHPMYSAFWLWAVAQALLLPNWGAGFSGVVGFGILFFGRVGREEKLMLETFGDHYREYMTRTNRVIPRIF
jgi:protein-S-isoprenylcysteine O-methyltransferase Ste14